VLDDEAEEERGVRVIMVIDQSRTRSYVLTLSGRSLLIPAKKRERAGKGAGRLVDIEEG